MIRLFQDDIGKIHAERETALFAQTLPITNSSIVTLF